MKRNVFQPTKARRVLFAQIYMPLKRQMEAMMSESYIRNNLKENVNYTDDNGLPIKYGELALSTFPGMTGTCHWHNDIEIILIQRGSMDYYVEGNSYRLGQGAGIIVNTDRLHHAAPVKGTDCIFELLMFHPSLLSSNWIVQNKYVEPLLKDSQNDVILLDQCTDWTVQVRSLSEQILEVCKQKKQAMRCACKGYFLISGCYSMKIL